MHVGTSDFGIESDFLQLFETAININSTLSQAKTDFWRIMRYETDYGIFNHDLDTSPESAMSIVAMHPAEDPIIGSRLRERLTIFVELQITTKLGLSWTEFTKQPVWVCDEQIRICRIENERLLKAAVAASKP